MVGHRAPGLLEDVPKAVREGTRYDCPLRERLRSVFHEQTFRYFGYGFLNDVAAGAQCAVTFWSFRIMVGLGF
jgi:hypothetical protein